MALVPAPPLAPPAVPPRRAQRPVGDPLLAYLGSLSGRIRTAVQERSHSVACPRDADTVITCFYPSHLDGSKGLVMRSDAGGIQ